MGFDIEHPGRAFGMLEALYPCIAVSRSIDIGLEPLLADKAAIRRVGRWLAFGELRPSSGLLALACKRNELTGLLLRQRRVRPTRRVQHFTRQIAPLL